MCSWIRSLLYVFVSLYCFLLPPNAGANMLGSLQRDGSHVDLVMRKITVSPTRAHVGDTIRIDMVLEYRGDMISNYYETTDAEVSANGKVVAKKPYVYNFGQQLGDTNRETLLWDTKGMAPGTYRIRGAVPLRLDATPYDNFLDVTEGLVLYPPGISIPEGEGGAAVAENRFLRDR